MPEITFRRILKSDPVSWALFPVFSERIRRMIHTYDLQINEEVFISEIQKMFVGTPELTFFVAALDDKKMVGHLLAWVTVSFGIPYVHVNQVEVDPPYSVLDARETILGAMAKWVAELNAAYASQGLPMRVTQAEMYTMRDPEVFERYLRSVSAKIRRRSVIYWSIPEVENAAVEKKPNGEAVM